MRSQLGWVSRWSRVGRVGLAVVEGKRVLRGAIRRTRRGCWETFLSQANDVDVRAVSRHISSRGATAIPTITHRGRVAMEHQDKAGMRTGLISGHCGSSGGFRPGQYGCRAERLAVGAVGVAITQIQEARG